MAKASDNAFPSLLLVEGSAPSSPASGDQRLYFDSADHHLKHKNSSGTVTDLESGGGGGSLEVTDGTHDLTSVTKITVTDLLVGGTAGASTLKPSLLTASAYLSGDVTMTNVTTNYDAVSVSLAAGTWILVAGILLKPGGNSSYFSATIWDGTTHVSDTFTPAGSTVFSYPLFLAAKVAPGSTTTYKLTAQGGDASGTIKANATHLYTSGNFGTYLIGFRIG